MLASMNLGRSYTTVNKLDSALLYETEAEQMTLKSDYKKIPRTGLRATWNYPR